MSGYTQNLNLFEYNTSTDGASKFNIDTALNDNFDKIDTFAGNVNANKANIDLSNLSQTGQAVINGKQDASTAVKHTANTAVGSASKLVYVDANGNVVEGNSVPSTTSSVTSGSSSALTSGGAYTNLVRRYSTSSATGGTNTPVYVDSTGKVQSCGSSIENTRFDGQWVSSTKTLSTSTAIGTYTIDLSTYLPNDNYNYEVCVYFAGFRQSGDSNSQVTVSSSSVTTTYNQNNLPDSVFSFTSFDGNHAECGNFNCNIIISTNRKFYFNIRNATLGYSGLYATAYRRIGSNT